MNRELQRRVRRRGFMSEGVPRGLRRMRGISYNISISSGDKSRGLLYKNSMSDEN